MPKIVDYLEIFPAAARTTAQTGTDLTNMAHCGVKVVVDVTTYTAGSLTVTIQGKDRASGKYYTLLASAALAATGTTVYTVYPALTAAANVTASDVLPESWRVITAVGGSQSITYSVGASLLV